MRRRRFLGAAPAALVLTGAGFGLASCGSRAPEIDLLAVGDRVLRSFEAFDKFLKDNNVTEVGDAELDRLQEFLTEVMNADPALYNGRIAMKMESDASFDGYHDAGGDGAVDGDKKLFKVEVDSENKRIILTDATGGSTSLGAAGMGFLAGALIGSMLGRQRAAGVGPGAFNNRNVTPASSYARGRAKSGGLFGGK